MQGQAHWWLFKPIKVTAYRRYDDWAEKLASELARLINLPFARVEFAYGARSGNHLGQRDSERL